MKLLFSDETFSGVPWAIILPPDSPPLTLRVDFDETPIDRLELLLQKTREPAYSTWLKTLPHHPDPHIADITQSAE